MIPVASPELIQLVAQAVAPQAVSVEGTVLDFPAQLLGKATNVVLTLPVDVFENGTLIFQSPKGSVAVDLSGGLKDLTQPQKNAVEAFLESRPRLPILLTPGAGKTNLMAKVDFPAHLLVLKSEASREAKLIFQPLKATFEVGQDVACFKLSDDVAKLFQRYDLSQMTSVEVPESSVQPKLFGDILAAHPLRGKALEAGADFIRAPVGQNADKPVRFKLLPLSPANAEDSEAIEAVVIGKTSSDQAVVQTKDGVYLVRDPVDVVVGTKLRLGLPRENLDRDALEPRDPRQTLARIAELLGQLEGMDVMLPAHASVPRPGAQLAPALLFFFTSLAKGGVSGWFEDTVQLVQSEALRRAMKDAKLDKTEQDAPVPAKDGEVGRWNLHHFPLHDGQQTQVIPLYVHRESMDRNEQEGKREKREEKTRFLVNLDLSNLGPLQMDGLVQKKRLDLILRSEKPLPLSLTTTLPEVWADTLAALDLTGQLLFQPNRQGWISPTPVTEQQSAVC